VTVGRDEPLADRDVVAAGAFVGDDPGVDPWAPQAGLVLHGLAQATARRNVQAFAQNANPVPPLGHGHSVRRARLAHYPPLRRITV
jgi:hypothetical protein